MTQTRANGIKVRLILKVQKMCVLKYITFTTCINWTATNYSRIN